MPAWYYFARPTNLAFHDLTTDISPPRNVRQLLGLGLKFIPTPEYTTSPSVIAESTFPRFERDLHLRAFFAADTGPDDENDPRLSVKSTWSPPPWTLPQEHRRRLEAFELAVTAAFTRRRFAPNLLSNQRLALAALRRNSELLVVQADKNLGPAVIERSAYIEMAFRDHLRDQDTYRLIPDNEVPSVKARIRRLLSDWLKQYTKKLSKSERKFLRAAVNASPVALPTFYLTMKVHKQPLKSRPIVSCSGTYLQPLGVWVDRKLHQSVAGAQRSYFKSSFDLKQELLGLDVPPGALLFTADAVSMYTNIETPQALRSIARYLREHTAAFPDLCVPALVDALRLVMKNNYFSFGNLHFHQQRGTAMGTPPAPPYATLFYATHEDSLLADFADELFFYRRFIDDVFGIWIPGLDHATRWPRFCHRMNALGLTWEVSPLSTRVDFMDLTITLSNGRLSTTLYAKPMALYQYISPHSCHPPGMLSGLVMGVLHRIYTLCSDPSDCLAHARDFYDRLRARGHQPEALRPLFSKGAAKAVSFLAAAAHNIPRRRELDPSSIFLHLEFHPGNPSSRDLQSIWRREMYHPPYRQPLDQTVNHRKERLPTNRLIIAYSRPPNMGNLLSYRKLDHGPPVSSFWTRDTGGPVERERDSESEREIERETETSTSTATLAEDLPATDSRVRPDNPFAAFARR